MKNYLMRLLFLTIFLLSLTTLTSCGGGSKSDLDPELPPDSPPANSEWVKGTEASVLAYPNQICLNWETRSENPDTYRIYRFKLGVLDSTIDTSSNFYNYLISSDNSLQADVAYHYRVTWIKNGIEYGKDAPLVVGICSTKTEIFEHNDTYAQAKALTTGDYTVHTFVFNDGTVDTDWYYCENTDDDTAMVIKIKLISTPAGIEINYYQSNEEQELTSEENLLIVGPNTTMYFKIEPVSVSGEGIGTYQIKVE